MYNFIPIYLLIIISITISTLLVLLSRFLSLNNTYSSKVSPYECGFDALGDARQKFDISFFIVAILFLIFDLEISYLLPWAVSYLSISIKSYTIILLFLFILSLGFVYEWLKGGLEWQ